MTKPKKPKQHVFEVTLVSGEAEAALLIAANDEADAVEAAWNRLLVGDVCWEGTPARANWADKLTIEDQGEDEGQ